MPSFWAHSFAIAFAGYAAATSFGSAGGSSASCRLEVITSGDPVGQVKTVNGVEIYHSLPSDRGYDSRNASKAVLFVTDIYGIAAPINRLVADSIARAGYKVIMPDLFNGDPVPVEMGEGPALNLTAWRERHPISDIDRIIGLTIGYVRGELGVSRLGGVGYCLGGKHVPRAMASSAGIDVGFVAHPSNLTDEEIQAIAGPFSIAAGELDAAFNSTRRRQAEDILTKKNATYETTLYSGAPHGFGVRADLNIPRQRFAKQAAYVQAVSWFDAWL